MERIVVYRDPQRYAGWPANYGIWSWGDEIVVGFTLGYPNPEGGFHTRDRRRPFTTMQARSRDGGQTWDVGSCPCPAPGGRALSADEHMAPELRMARALEQELEPALQDCPGGIPFTHPDFALLCARTGLGAGTRAWFYTSLDRCHSWQGPWKLPPFGQPGIEARTDYLVSGPDTCTLFLTASKADGGEGDHIFCARTVDGGRTFAYRARVTGDYGAGWTIMPSSVRLSPSQIVTAVRCRGEGTGGQAENWIDLYASPDDGATWSYLSRPVSNTGQGGNPPAMVRLQDGRLCLTYGYRDPPFGIRARLSADSGVTWGTEQILRDGAGSHDLGYPRTVQRPDGMVITVYYDNDHPAGERYIAATLWRP